MPFVLKKSFLDKSNLEVISKQPAREILMLLWAFLVLEAGKKIGYFLEADEISQFTPETLADKTKIPQGIVKLGFSLFLQLGMIEQQGNEQQQEAKQQSETGFQKIRSSLSGMPLDKLTDAELEVLERKHGSERLELVCEIAAETWKKTKKEIHSPGGYLNVLCGSIKIPVWYTVKGDKGDTEAGSQSKLKDFWDALSEEDRKSYLLRAKNSMPESMENAPPEAIDAVAKQIIAWNEYLFDWVREQL